jgi:hypothetical protein
MSLDINATIISEDSNMFIYSVTGRNVSILKN